MELKPSPFFCFGPWPTKTGSNHILNHEALKKSIPKGHFVRVPMIAPFVIFLVVCSSDTYAPIKPVKQVAYQPHEAYSKTQTKQEGSEKVDIKVIPKVRRFGGRERHSFGIIGHQMPNWE